MGAVSIVKPSIHQYLSNIFLRPKPDGSKRLILNLSKLNKFIKTNHFKMEDHKTVTKLISHKCYMSTIDLKDAYFLLPIAKIHRKFLRFQFAGKLYQFNCMPFGLNCAPLVFTKLMKPVIRKLREQNLTSVIYLDDLLLIGKSFSDCKNNVQTTIKLLVSLGFIVNHEKSKLQPKLQQKFLGFIYNSESMTVFPPSEKREKVRNLVKQFSSKNQCKIREFASFIGTLISICPAIKYSWGYTKAFERAKFVALQENNENYNAIMKIPSDLQNDFNWWLNNISAGYNTLKPLKFQLEIFSDACKTGWGICSGSVKSHGLWNVKEKELHINYLELLASFFGLKCFANHIKNCDILCKIDNTTAISYINRMGSIQYPQLNHLAREIWQWCEVRNNFIYASYINSKDNFEADDESRKIEKETEWELKQTEFLKIIKTFNKPDVDLFASRINKKCEKFVSWRRDPEAWAVDAFTLDWSKFYFYAFPPFCLILKVLQKIINDNASGILIVPNWTTQPWYPLFKSLLTKEPIHLKPNKSLLLSFDRTPHPLWKSISLVVGHLSGKL